MEIKIEQVSNGFAITHDRDCKVRAGNGKALLQYIADLIFPSKEFISIIVIRKISELAEDEMIEIKHDDVLKDPAAIQREAKRILKESVRYLLTIKDLSNIALDELIEDMRPTGDTDFLSELIREKDRRSATKLKRALKITEGKDDDKIK